jgi:Ricin-type beta-trefoil lectin domain
MSKLFKLITTLIIALSIVIGSTSIFTTNINIQAKNKEGSISKKKINKKLALKYTADRFETDLNQDQKNAILKSLKKWKGELPIDNLFTVTSIAKLKSDTDDENRQHKKKNKNIADALVIYMWSQTPNPDYDPNNLGDNEEGDSRFIRTQFNVLLKQNKNGGWKASLERDPETKTESADITETDEDKQIYNDLFATDKADNGFTATEEVIIDDNAAENIQPPKKSTVKSDSGEPVQITPIQKSSISSIAPVLVTPIDDSSMMPEPVEKKTGWLNNFLGFGSIKVSAGVSEISWPWNNGESWQVTQGWHGCEKNDSRNSPAGNNFIGELNGCALDISYTYTGASNILKAPITSTITRSCKDNDQGIYNFGNKVSITHIKASSMSSDTGAFIRKFDNIGIVFDPGFENHNFDLRWQQINGVGPYGFQTICGWTSGPHIHIKFAAITDPLLISNPVSTMPFNSRSLAGNVNIDGFNIQGPKILPLRADGLQNYDPIVNGQTVISRTFLTSQNTPNTNTYTGKIKALSNTNMVFDIKDYNGGNNAPVMLYSNNAANTENQRWGYDGVNRQIKGMNGKCLDLGITTNTPDRGLKMQDCTANVNQKWGFSSDNQIVSISNPSTCIEALSGVVNNSILAVNSCNLINYNQKWDFSEIANLTSTTKINVRVNLSGAWNNTTKLMNTGLNTSNLIPLNQPYCTSPWNYCGTENIPNRANIDQTAVDWVLVEIKNSAGTTIQKKAALITSDAYLTNPQGINSPGTYYSVPFENIKTSGNYKIIVRHRNHLAISTDTNVALTANPSGSSPVNTVDLRNNINVKSANQANLGTNSAGQTVYGMRLGNVNGDGLINVLDVSAILNASSSTLYDIYDVNLNGITNVVDTGLVRNAPAAVEAI